MFLGIDIDILGLIVDISGFVATIVIFVVTLLDGIKATKEQTRRECVRATLSDFATIRRTHQDFALHLTEENRNIVLKDYLADLERFAVGCNVDAYALDIVNSMSGGMLVTHYKKYFRDFILERRRSAMLNGNVKPWNMYSEYERMMKGIFELRHQKWEPPMLLTEEEAILDKFLNMKVSSSEEVFEAFRGLNGAIEHHGKGKEGFLYVPGSREDRCVIAAHADTFFDVEYQKKVIQSKLGFKDGVYFSETQECGIGADDRAGCAMLWLLRESGHSLLILDGEEHGQIGAHYMKENYPEIFNEINEHSFILQLDRRGKKDYKCYDLPVTEEFKKFVEKSTNYVLSQSSGKTDICTLCTKVCGVNLSVGYENEHKPNEILNYKDWLHTYQLVKAMLKKPLKKYAMKPKK